MLRRSSNKGNRGPRRNGKRQDETGRNEAEQDNATRTGEGHGRLVRSTGQHATPISDVLLTCAAQMVRQKQSEWQALPSGEARVVAAGAFVETLFAWLQEEFGIHIALAEIAHAEATEVTGTDLRARRGRLLRAIARMLYVLRYALSTAVADMLTGDVLSFIECKPGEVLYPLSRQRGGQEDGFQGRFAGERFVLRLEYETGRLGVNRAAALAECCTTAVSDRTVDKWAQTVSREAKQSHRVLGRKVAAGATLSPSQQKSCRSSSFPRPVARTCWWT